MNRCSCTAVAMVKLRVWIPFQICYILPGFIDKPVLIGRMEYKPTAQSNATRATKCDGNL